MCDRSLCRSGYVGSLLNLPSAADSFYFPNLRANGSHQLAASLPSLPYPRSSIAWSCASPCPAQPAGHAAFSSSPQPPPYLAAAGSLPLSLNSSSSADSKASPDNHRKYYEAASKHQDEQGGVRQSRELIALAGDPGGMPSPAKALKDEPRGLHGAPAALVDAEPCAPGFKGDLKRAINLNLTLPPAAAAQPSLRPSLQDGMPYNVYALVPL